MLWLSKSYPFIFPIEYRIEILHEEISDDPLILNAKGLITRVHKKSTLIIFLFEETGWLEQNILRANFELKWFYLSKFVIRAVTLV